MRRSRFDEARASSIPHDVGRVRNEIIDSDRKNFTSQNRLSIMGRPGWTGYAMDAKLPPHQMDQDVLGKEHPHVQASVR